MKIITEDCGTTIYPFPNDNLSRIEIRKPNKDVCRTETQINWSASGARNIKAVKLFQKALNKALEIAEKI